MRDQVQLITYINRLEGDLKRSKGLLDGKCYGLFGAVLNSKGVSCFRKPEQGAVAGVISFFTCISAVLGPLAMAAISDHFGSAKYGFLLATAFAALLFMLVLLNWILNPTRNLLNKLDATEYHLLDTDVESVEVRN